MSFAVYGGGKHVVVIAGMYFIYFLILFLQPVFIFFLVEVCRTCFWWWCLVFAPQVMPLRYIITI